MARAFHTLALLVAVALAAGCSVKDTPTPDFAAPSELALSLSMSATPDTINQDGSSQALVVVIARDSTGRAVVGLPVRFDVTQNGQPVAFGGLSAKTATTSGDGRASTVYTAPAPPASSVDGATTVRVLATPTGTNYANVVPHAVDIKLIPPGAVHQPGYGPVAEFTGWEPAPSMWGAGVPAVFDASRSSSPAGLVSYAWDFGDGTTGSGVSAQHTFTVGGTYFVRLTVTDTKGQTAWVTHPVTVAAGPTAVFTWTPASPSVGLPVTFYGGESWAVPPSGIVDYIWEFGDGSPVVHGISQPHTYLSARTYTVRLTVIDDNGFVGRLTQTVEVK